MFAKFIPLLVPLNDPVAPQPIKENVDKIINWVTWIGMSVCILGIIIAGTMMALGQRRGEGGEHASRLGWVIAGCVVIGAASGLVGAFF